MKRLSQHSLLSRQVIDLYDEYTHRPLSRRLFLARLQNLLGGSAALYAVLPLLENNYAQAEQVAGDDVRLQAQDVNFGAKGQAFAGYLVQPRAEKGRLPAVILIHENRGLNPHIRDVARRLALEGFLVLAPDYLSAQGGTPADEDKAREWFARLPAAQAGEMSLAALAYLQNAGNGRVGAVGFCWGGGQALQLAVLAPDLQAAVAYYGMPVAATEVPRIRARLLLHYAGLDDRINAAVPAFEGALQSAGIPYERHVYPGVNHAFNNDSNAARYDAAAAGLAWQRTLAFLRRVLA